MNGLSLDMVKADSADSPLLIRVGTRIGNLEH